MVMVVLTIESMSYRRSPTILPRMDNFSPFSNLLTLAMSMTRLANPTARLSRYKNCIVTQLGLNQDKCCPSPVATQSLCHDAKTLVTRAGVSQPSCTVSWPLFWPYRGRAYLAMRACCGPPSPAYHYIMHCIVTQHQNGQ